MIFDIVLDQNAKKVGKEDCGQTKGYWYWYPNQEIAHMHKKKLYNSIQRFRYIGYPGTFRTPVYHSFYQLLVEIKEEQYLIWDCIDGRIRFILDGRELDITDRKVLLTLGEHKIQIELDYASTLPAVYLEMEQGKVLDDLLVSLDKKTYKKSRYCIAKTRQKIDVLEDRKETYSVHIDACVLEDEERVFELPYYDLGQMQMSASGEGTVEIIVGQSREEVLAEREELEQIQQKAWKINEKNQAICSTQQALKFVCIRVRGKVFLSDIYCRYAITKVEYRGSVKVTDSEVEKYYYMGAATIRSCMDGFILDAIYRDALPWALDSISAIYAMDYVFGEHRITRDTLLSQVLPLEATVKELGTTYFDFQLYTLLGFENDYTSTGDVEFLLEYKREIYHIADLYLELCSVSDKGYLSTIEIGCGSFFPDWSTGDNVGLDIKGVATYAQMLLVHGLEFVAFLAELDVDLEKALRYHTSASTLRCKIVEEFRDINSGLFYNGYDRHGQIDRNFSCYAQIFGVVFDFIEEESYSVVERELCCYENRHRSISINFIWEMMCLSKMRATGAVRQLLEQALGPILQAGDTRIYEDIRRDGLRTLDFYGRAYGKSLCHSVMGAAAVVGVVCGLMGVQKYMTEYQSYRIINLKEGLEEFTVKIPVHAGYIQIQKDKNTCVVEVTGECSIQLQGYTTADGVSSIEERGRYRLVGN